jgi:X-X-X-Leu-X-X-Gly heptad repeat protein
MIVCRWVVTIRRAIRSLTRRRWAPVTSSVAEGSAVLAAGSAVLAAGSAALAAGSAALAAGSTALAAGSAGRAATAPAGSLAALGSVAFVSASS